MRFDAIVFDFDGVLVESAGIKTRAFGAMYAKYGPEVARRVVAYHLAHAGISRYEKFKVWQEQFLGLTYREEDAVRLASEFSELVVKAVIAAPYVPGAYDFLLAYHQRHPLFVASGTPEEELQEIVAKRDMAKYFVTVSGAPKTKGETLRCIIKSYDFEPARVLMVGDARADWEGAQEAGASFVGRASAESRELFPPRTQLIADLRELPQFVEVAIQ